MHFLMKQLKLTLPDLLMLIIISNVILKIINDIGVDRILKIVT
jgi:hypothetical protein